MIGFTSTILFGLHSYKMNYDESVISKNTIISMKFGTTSYVLVTILI